MARAKSLYKKDLIPERIHLDVFCQLLRQSQYINFLSLAKSQGNCCIDFHAFFIAGVLQVEGKILTGRGALYVVERPATGVWKLVSSSSSYVTAKCVSLENIDFEYNFLVQVKVGLRHKVISSKEPLHGMILFYF